ncbi:hypothetical protein MMC26_000274 [Xylographa opegraphella]|nr:hypothetical protein [Xylographa opegraphella]
MDDEDDQRRRPMQEYVRLYNAGYPLHEIQRYFREQRRLQQHPMTSSSLHSQHQPSFEQYRDEGDEKRWFDSPTLSDGDWTSAEEDEHIDKETGFSTMSANAYYRNSSLTQRPLVNYIRNDWQTDPRYGQRHSPPPDGDEYGPPDCIQIMSAKKLRRVVGLLLLSLVLSCIAWAWWLGPKLSEHLMLKGSLDTRIQAGKGWFGVNMRPKFADMVQLETLDASLVPTGERGSKRLIVVGDVHGCKDELSDLLSKLSFHPSTDHLILAGDLVSKGPSSSAVVSLALSLNASCVRGNHEDRVLLAHRDLNSRSLKPVRSSIPDLKSKHYTPNPSQPSDADNNAFPHGDATDRALAASLSPAEIAYLAACPVILRVGPIPSMGDVSVVHAGLVPGVALERQDPSAVMSMRSIDLGTHVPSRDANEGVPWTKLWNKYQGMLPKRQRSTVLYGHDSKRGLVLDRWSKGLDTGCVKGGRLSALVLGEGGWRGGVGTRVVSVKCRDYRPRELGVLGQS